MALPECFCWTRFGTEAGLKISKILVLKEEERVRNGRTFLWGIGNAIGPSINALASRTEDPQVLFSPMKSAPKRIDITPTAIADWTYGEDLHGNPFEMPKYSCVTSRFDPTAPKKTHYGLVCASEGPLMIRENAEQILISEVENLRTGSPVAASQVTAVVRRVQARPGRETAYSVAFRAELVRPYFIRLRNPVVR